MLENFDEWVREAERGPLAPGDYPRVDSSQVDMADELLRTAERTLVRGVDFEVTGYNPGEIEGTVEFLEVRLIRSNFALAVRFVILNFLYRLAHLEVSGLAEWPLLHEIVWPHFERFVGLPVLDPGALQEPRVVQWEITNACLTYHWDLAASLFDRLKFLGAITASQCLALKGQVQVAAAGAVGEACGYVAQTPGWDCELLPDEGPLRGGGSGEGKNPDAD